MGGLVKGFAEGGLVQRAVELGLDRDEAEKQTDEALRAAIHVIEAQIGGVRADRIAPLTAKTPVDWGKIGVVAKAVTDLPAEGLQGLAQFFGLAAKPLEAVGGAVASGTRRLAEIHGRDVDEKELHAPPCGRGRDATSCSQTDDAC